MTGSSLLESLATLVEPSYLALVALERQYVADLDALSSLYHTLEQADHSILRLPAVTLCICTVLEIKAMHTCVLQRLEECRGNIEMLAQTYANLAQLMDLYTVRVPLAGSRLP